MTSAATARKPGVQDIFDKHGPKAMERLFAIAFGHRIRVGTPSDSGAHYIYPTEGSQMRALQVLAKKLHPDLASHQPDTAPRSLDPLPSPSVNHRQLGRAILSILGQAVLAEKQPNEKDST